MFFVCFEIGKYDLMLTKSAFIRLSIDHMGPSPTFRRYENYHWPAWPGGHIPLPSIGLYALYFKNNLIELFCHSLMHRLRVFSFDDVRYPAVPAEQLV